MENLKKLRLAKGLSQQALADRRSLSQQTIYKYENGITEPNIDMLKDIADFFDVSIDYLTGHSPYTHKIEEVQETALNADELSLIRKYRSLPFSSRQAHQQLMDDYLGNHNS